MLACEKGHRKIVKELLRPPNKVSIVYDDVDKERQVRRDWQRYVDAERGDRQFGSGRIRSCLQPPCVPRSSTPHTRAPTDG